MVLPCKRSPDDCFFYSAATLECQAMGLRQDTQFRHIMETQGQTNIVLSVNADTVHNKLV